MKIKMFFSTDYDDPEEAEDAVNKFIKGKNIADVKLIPEDTWNAKDFTALVMYKK